MSGPRNHTRGAPPAVPFGPFDLLRLQGAESLDLLQRISTNDLRGLRAGEARSTVFTTEKGRIVDFVRVLAAEDGAFLIASGGAGPSLSAWIGRFVIMEDILVSDLSATAGLRAVAGGDARAVLPSGAGTWKQEGEGRGITCAMEEFGIPWIFAEEIPHGTGPGSALQDAGAMVRILQGIPARGAELQDAFTPYDAGLTWAVSTTKGCYVGQEVLARLDTYQKIRRRLAGVLFEAPPGSIRPGAALLSGDAEAGVLTSTAPAEGVIAALAVLRTDIGEGDAVMSGPDGETHRGTVFGLPAGAEVRARIPDAPPA